jgi:hypothetical protein
MRTSSSVVAMCILCLVSVTLTGCPKEEEKPAAGAGPGAPSTPAAPAADLAKEKMTLTLKPNHAASLAVDGEGSEEIAWEPVSDDKAMVQLLPGVKMDFFRNPDGSLRDGEGEVWTPKK